MKLPRRIAAALSVTTLLLTLACSSGAEGERSITIGLAVSTLNSPYFVQLTDGARKAAAGLGVTLAVVDAQNDSINQINQVQTFATQRVPAIIINPVDSTQAKPAVAAAENASIPLISVDRTIDGGKLTSQIHSDNVQGGRLAAIELGRIASGAVVHLQGIPGTSASRDRGQGFGQALSSGSGPVQVVAIQPADFDRAKGLDVMTNLLQSYPTLTGVFAENDEMALGAIKALGSRAGREVQVIGFDGTPEALSAITAGTMAATIAQQPEVLGRTAVEQAVKAARGEPVQPVIEVAVKIVTRANVAEFR